MKKIIFCLLLLTGCGGGRNMNLAPTPKPQPTLDLKLEDDAKKVEDSAEVIDKKAVVPEVKGEAKVLKVVANDLYKKAKENKVIIKRYTEMTEAVHNYESDEGKRMSNIFFILISLGGIFTAAGVGMMVFAPKGSNIGDIGLKALIVGLVIIAISWGLIRLLKIKWIGIILGLVVLSGALCYFLYKYSTTQAELNKSEHDKKRAENTARDAVRTTEVIKKHGWNEESKEIVKTVQDPESAKMIAEIKQADKV